MGALERRQQRQAAPMVGDLSAARQHRPDYGIVLLTVALLGIGLVVMYAISPALAALGGGVQDNYFTFRQAVAAVIGLIVFYIVSKIPLGAWMRWQKPLLIVALALSLTTIATGGLANRWIQLGTFSFQPVELVKFVLVVVLAGILTRLIESGDITNLRALRPLMVGTLVFGAVIVGLQRDLGSTVVLFAMAAVMAFVAGVPMKKLVLFGLSGLILGMLAIGSTAYRRERMLTFFQPERDCQVEGYQACQAMIAVGSGGVFGLGLGNSIQAYGYLPKAANDSIFAIYAEKFGFLGVMVLLGLIGALLLRILGVMQRAPNRYAQIVCAGVFAWLSVQALINIGAMIGLLPLKGITLPFISYGGTSLIFVMAALGLVFHISKYTTTRSQQFDIPEQRRNQRGRSGSSAYRTGPSAPTYTITRTRDV